MAETFAFLTDKAPLTTNTMNNYTPAPTLTYSFPANVNTGTPLYAYMTDTSVAASDAMTALTPPAVKVYTLPNHAVWSRKGDYPWNSKATPAPTWLTISFILPDTLNHNLWIWTNGNSSDIATAQSLPSTYASVKLPDVL